MTRELFAVSTFCALYDIDRSFIQSLYNEGLITITYRDEDEFLEEEQLHELELYVRWHQDLGINPEGMDAIRHLLEKVKNLQAEVGLLKSRLNFYERNAPEEGE